MLYLNRLIDVYRDKNLKNQSRYEIENFYLSLDTYNTLKNYIEKHKKGGNLVLVLAIVGEARHR